MRYDGKWEGVGLLDRIQFIAAGHHVYVKAGKERLSRGFGSREVFELRQGGEWRSVGEKFARSLAIGPEGRIWLNDGNYEVFQQENVDCGIEKVTVKCDNS